MLDATQNANELALIQALNRLKGYQFDTDSVDGAPAVDADQTAQTYFAFDIGDHHFAVSAESFCEVLIDANIAAVPNAPPHLAGLCSLRGLLVPVFQLHHGFEVALPKKNIIFCIGKGENTLALLVDALPLSISLRPYEKLHETALEHDLIKRLSESAYFSKGRVLHLIEGIGLGEKLLAIDDSVASVEHKAEQVLQTEFH